MGKNRKHKKTRKSSDVMVDEVYESVKRDVTELSNTTLPNGDPFVVAPGVADMLYAIRSTDKAFKDVIEHNQIDDGVPKFFKQREFEINRSKLNRPISDIKLKGKNRETKDAINQITPPIVNSDRPYIPDEKNGPEKPPIYGHWIHDTKEASDYVGGIVYLRSCTCSVCGEHKSFPTPTCTYCGAIMEDASAPSTK